MPLAVAALLLALASVPRSKSAGSLRRIDWLGASLFAVAMVGLVFALTQGQPSGWLSPQTVVPLIVAVIFAVAFVRVEQPAADPLIDGSLFRRLNFTGATISQVIAGMLELGLGFLLPFYLLLAVGVGPIVAGLALIPGTIPIILVGPLAGRLFDRIGGRWPLTIGFVVLALSGIALGIGAGADNIVSLIPGLLLQGVGLGIVLTVNDPVGMNALDDSDQGQGAGIINTAEQVGGAIGIAALGALQIGYYYRVLYAKLAAEGIKPTDEQIATVHEFIAQAEQRGMRNVPADPVVALVYEDWSVPTSHPSSSPSSSRPGWPWSGRSRAGSWCARRRAPCPGRSSAADPVGCWPSPAPPGRVSPVTHHRPRPTRRITASSEHDLLHNEGLLAQ
ncbi:MAG TPA: MFS transporter [Microlunatus sp.]